MKSETRRKEIKTMLEAQGIQPSVFSDLMHELNSLVREESNEQLLTGIKEYLQNLRDVTSAEKKLYSDKLIEAVNALVKEDPEPINLEPLVKALNCVEKAILDNRYEDRELQDVLKALDNREILKEISLKLDKEVKESKTEVNIDTKGVIDSVKSLLEHSKSSFKYISALIESIGTRKKPLHVVQVDKEGNYLQQQTLSKDEKTQQWIIGGGVTTEYTANAKGERINPATEEGQVAIIEAIQGQSSGGTASSIKIKDSGDNIINPSTEERQIEQTNVLNLSEVTLESIMEMAQNLRILGAIKGQAMDIRVSVVNTPNVGSVTTVTTVATVTTVGTVTNLAQIGAINATPVVPSLMNSNAALGNIQNILIT